MNKSFCNQKICLVHVQFILVCIGVKMESSTFSLYPFSTADSLLENETVSVVNSSIPPATTVLLPRSFQTVDLVVRIIEGLLAVITNGFTVYSVVKYEFLRSSNANILILNLALADFIGGLAPFFLTIRFNSVHNPSQWLFVCIIEHSLNMISSGLNMLLIIAISLDRVLYINFPLHYVSWIKRWHIMVVLSVCWAYAVGTSVLGLGVGLTDDHGFICHTRAIVVPKWNRFINEWKTYSGHIFLATIVLLNLNIACVALKQYSKIRQEEVG